MSVARDTAIQLLSHYLETVYKKTGLKWDGDNQAEIEDLVDSLLNAALDPVIELERKVDQPDWRQRT